MATHQPPETWRDNAVETAKYQVIRARLLLDERDFDTAADLARAVISSLDGQQLRSVVAEAYGVLSDAARGTGEVGPGERYRGKAMGLYLAAGSPQAAEALAAHFLETTTPAPAHLTDQEAQKNMEPADVCPDTQPA